MEKKIYDFKKIGTNEIEIIKELFIGVFTIEPWNDDWSNQEQLNLYLLDLIGQSNSLTYGLFENGKLIGVSMGHIKHWYSGTEYYIEELCIQTNKQGNGIGTYFLKEIEKAINKSEIGISPQNDGKVIRLNFPPLTEERRKELVKTVKKYSEEAKVQVRNVRRDAMDDFKKKQKASEITEDDLKGIEKDIQNLTDKYIKEIDAITNAKSKEIMEI